MTLLPLMSEPILAHEIGAHEGAGLGCLMTGRGNLPLTDVDIDAHVTGLLHTTRVRQTFTNPHDEPLEATYIFPLPDRAAVTAFRMTVGDRVIEGLLQERAEARRNYDEAIAEGRRAAIAEEERPNVFTVRVGNLIPGDRAVVELTLVGPLILDSGEATWRFPLVVAPRYIPGTPLPGDQVGDGTELDTDAVPDASRLTPPVLLPGFPNPVRLSARVDIDGGGLPISGLRSNVPAEVDGTVVTIRPGRRLDRDLVVRFDVGDEGIGTSLVAHEGTFALTVVPPNPKLGAPAKPRDVVFVLDRSGSMGGWKMIAARRAVARMIDTLGSADRFTVIAFDDRVETPSTLEDGLITASDRNRFRAVEYLATLDARGGTEMLAPLQQAARLLGGDDPARARVLVLATDGQVGNEDQILAAIAPAAMSMRIFTVGIDTAVNDAFLRRIAAAGGGSCEVVESEDRLDEVMERIHRRISTPVLSNVAIVGTGLRIDADSVAPARLPALHAGAPLVVLGRFDGPADGTVRVTATDAAGAPWSVDVAVSPHGSAALTPVWARAHIRDLEDRYVVAYGDSAIERRIVEVSLAGQVLSRFTAFVATDVTVVVEKGTARRVTQPVELPAGWDQPSQLQPEQRLLRAAFAPMSAAPTTGAGFGASMPPPAPGGAPMAAPPMDHSDGGGFIAGVGARLSGRPGGAAPKRAIGRSSSSVRSKEPKRAASPQMETAAVPEPLDLAPYRRRAAEIAERVHSGGLNGAGLRRELADLVADLRSTGATDADVAALERLIAAIDSGDGWSIDALTEFAGPARKAFWKR
jgi:Ca-activated chloride channel homolog